MKRWDYGSEQEVVSASVDAFIAEIIPICHKHGYWIKADPNDPDMLVVTVENHRRLLKDIAIDAPPTR